MAIFHSYFSCGFENLGETMETSKSTGESVVYLLKWQFLGCTGVAWCSVPHFQTSQVVIGRLVSAIVRSNIWTSRLSSLGPLWFFSCLISRCFKIVMCFKISYLRCISTSPNSLHIICIIFSISVKINSTSTWWCTLDSDPLASGRVNGIVRESQVVTLLLSLFLFDEDPLIFR